MNGSDRSGSPSASIKTTGIIVFGMARTPPENGKAAGCPVGEVLRLLGKPYVLSILNAFSTGKGPLRFVQLQHLLGLSPNTLSQRLKELSEAGLLYRMPYNEIPPRVDYELTSKAHELMPIFEDLHVWAQKNDLSPLPGKVPGLAKTAAVP